jgi:hypothetical protein
MYWGTDVAYRLFGQAQAKQQSLHKQGLSKAAVGDSTANDEVENPTINLVPLTPNSLPLSTFRWRAPERQQAFGEDSVFDPDTLIIDDFSLTSLAQGELYGEFDLGMATLNENGRVTITGTFDNDMLVDYGVNSFLTADEFNRQILGLAEPR